MRRPGWLRRPMGALVVRAAAAAAALRVKSHTHTHIILGLGWLPHRNKSAILKCSGGGAGRANRATRAGFWRVGTCQRSIRTAIRRNRPPTGPRSACARRKTSNSPIASVVRECYRVQCARLHTYIELLCGARPNPSAGRIGADPSAPCVCDAVSGQCIMPHTSAPGERILACCCRRRRRPPPVPTFVTCFGPFFAQAAAAMLHKCNKRDLRLVFCVWPSGAFRDWHVTRNFIAFRRRPTAASVDIRLVNYVNARRHCSFFGPKFTSRVAPTAAGWRHRFSPIVGAARGPLLAAKRAISTRPRADAAHFVLNLLGRKSARRREEVRIPATHFRFSLLQIFESAPSNSGGQQLFFLHCCPWCENGFYHCCDLKSATMGVTFCPFHDSGYWGI
jgi:hypothetical protein